MGSGAVRQIGGGRTLRALPASGPTAPLPSDEDLIEAIERGDGSRASALYDRLVAVVDRTVLRVLGRRESDHDDLVQASFEQIVTTLARGRYARACSLTTWAASIASHVALNALRSRRRARNVFDEHGDADAPGPASTDGERMASARCEIERVRATLAGMAPEKAEVLFLHDVLGHELAEIAVMMNVSVAAAQSRLVRSRRELMERLQGGGR